MDKAPPPVDAPPVTKCERISSSVHPDAFRENQFDLSLLPASVLLPPYDEFVSDRLCLRRVEEAAVLVFRLRVYVMAGLVLEEGASSSSDAILSCSCLY